MDVLLDANAIIDLIELGCFDNILDSAALRFWVVENVTAEITYPTQREPLEQRIRQGRIRETQVERLEELQTYTELQRVLADGEAASLAVAGHRGWAYGFGGGTDLSRNVLWGVPAHSDGYTASCSTRRREKLLGRKIGVCHAAITPDSPLCPAI